MTFCDAANICYAITLTYLLGLPLAHHYIKISNPGLQVIPHAKVYVMLFTLVYPITLSGVWVCRRARGRRP